MSKRVLVAILAIGLTSAAQTWGEERANSWPPVEKGTSTWGLTFNVGVSHDIWDGVPGVGFHSTGVRVGRFFGIWGPSHLRGRIAFEVEIQPVFLMFQATSTYAFSTTLLGSHYFIVDSKLRPFVSFGAGVVLSAGDIPAETSRVNFTPQIGLGIAFAGRGGTVYAFEYRLHHISNGSLVDNNPGINSSFIQFSFSHFRERRRPD